MKTLRIILINVLVFLAILIIVDFALGIVLGIDQGSSEQVDRYTTLRENRPNVDRIRRLSASQREFTENLKDTTFRFRTDADGYIIGPRTSDGPVHIAFFGGSTTECLYVSEPSRFPYLTGELLLTEGGKLIRTLNGGRSGNNSLHSLIQLVAKGIPYRPEFVVLMHNINDFTGLSKTGSYWNAPGSRAITKTIVNKKPGRLGAILEGAKDIFAPNISNLVEAKLNSPESDDEWEGFRNLNEAPIEQRMPQMKADFEASIRSFVSVTKSWGGNPILMTQFNRYNSQDSNLTIKEFYNSFEQEFSYETFCTLYVEFNDVIRKVAREEEAFLIDLALEIPQESKYIYDGNHLNDEGSELAATLISKFLSDGFPNHFRLKND